MSDPLQASNLRPVPQRMIPMLEAFDGQVVQARDASTVVLLRAGPVGPEVYLMRRQQTMEFASGMHVFPGGGVEDSDFDEVAGWLGPPAERWGEAFGCDPDLARALVVAAARETFEETGVLLAGRDEKTVMEPMEDIADLRWAVEQHRLPFAQLLAERGLALRADLMAPWAHWVTPTFEPKRFDTRFFVCWLPDGQRVGELASEADSGGWRSLSGVIEQARAGSVAMMAPTLHVCRQLEQVEMEMLSSAAWSRKIPTVMPQIVTFGGRRFLDSPSPDELR